MDAVKSEFSGSHSTFDRRVAPASSRVGAQDRSVTLQRTCTTASGKHHLSGSPHATQPHHRECPVSFRKRAATKSFSHELLDTFDTQHLSPGIENFGNSVGVQNDPVVWLEFQFSWVVVASTASGSAPRIMLAGLEKLGSHGCGDARAWPADAQLRQRPCCVGEHQSWPQPM